MKVQLLLTCLCDTLYGEVGIATVRALEHVGCEVVFPIGQTCCGQPAYNAGDWKAAKVMMSRTSACFDPDVPVVTPSASCAATLRHASEKLEVEVPQCWELFEFLDEFFPEAVFPAGKIRTAAYHPACHGRGLQGRFGRPPSQITWIEWLPLANPEQCCGFGGAFAAHHAGVSAGIGDAKLTAVSDAGARTLIGTDMGCLMHLKGLADRQKLGLRILHAAEALTEGLA